MPNVASKIIEIINYANLFCFCQIHLVAKKIWKKRKQCFLYPAKICLPNIYLLVFGCDVIPKDFLNDENYIFTDMDPKPGHS